MTMKKSMKSLLPQAVGAAALLTSAVTTQAFFEDSSFYLVVPTVGYHYTDELDHYDKEKKTGHKFDFDDGPIYGLGFGFQANGYTATEFVYNYSNFDITGKDDMGDKLPTKEASYSYLHVDALYYFNNIYENDFSFYIPVGIGWMKNDPDAKGTDKSMYGYKAIEDTVLNFGVGAQYMFNDMWGVRGDIRGLYGFSQENFDAIAQLGLVIRFGVPVGMGGDDNIKSADIRFKLDSTEIINPNSPDIQALATALRNDPDANVKVLAYSDRSGSSDYNMKLSQQRADKIKDILVNNFGVDEARVYTKAMGDQAGTSRNRHAIAIVEY